MKKKPLSDKDGEVREITAAEMKRFKSIQKTDPEMALAMSLLKAKRSRGRPKIQAPRKMLSLRLKSNIIDEIKSTGKGYNTRIEKLLEEAIETGRL